MIDTKKLLDQFLGAGASGQMAGDPLGSIGKALQGGLGSLAGGAQDALGNKGALGGLAGGAVAGGLVSILLGSKSARKIGGKVLTYGGLAAVGAIAYSAYRNWQAGQGAAGTPAAPAGGPATVSGPAAAPALPPPGTPFDPASAPGGEAALAHTIVHAMIVAAKADGHVDDAERARILKQLGEIGLDGDERAFLDAELSKPLDIDGVVASATTPELAAEIYAASLIAVTADAPVGRAYLDLLAARLKLDPGLKSALEAAVTEHLAA
ncbi:tellurite resistance TerB family protein [Segnochrobactrum spirostomi]|uniref:Tellurite resistance TerB family protein n=1 Tax=Segnochrobactrum spirostomi TaxID=2608987 RepID=A0A6A7Y6B0_9HYPH|nr:tellurite resistance TerB family protein [Segnochrobactrum spirostomi]MQT13837.1 tellurite resistance TerB family protein [Segnochrobactrum spirostomi]